MKLLPCDVSAGQSNLRSASDPVDRQVQLTEAGGLARSQVLMWACQACCGPRSGLTGRLHAQSVWTLVKPARVIGHHGV